MSDDKAGDSLRDAWTAFEQSEGMRQYKAQRSSYISFTTYAGNREELLFSVKRAEEITLAKSSEDSTDVKLALNEVSRCLHNFLAAAITLVEHTRNFMRDSWGNDSREFSEYDAEVKRRFSSVPLVAFTACLRHQFLHVRMPSLTSVYHLAREACVILLDVSEMKNQERFTGLAREFIQTNGKDLVIRDFVGAYDREIVAFYNWLGPKVNEWGKEEREKTLALMHRLQRD